MTDIWFPLYLAQFFLQREIFHTNVVETIKTHIVYSTTFFRKPCSVRYKEKECTARQATDDKGAHALHAGYLRPQTLSQNIYVLLYHGNNGCTNAPQFYILPYLVQTSPGTTWCPIKWEPGFFPGVS